VTTAALSAALDVASRRQALVAANIANGGTPGYAPLRLSFGAQLDEARTALREGRLLDADGLDALRSLAELPPEPEEGRGGVQLDVEMVELARNAAHFQALIQGVSRHLSLQALAAADGRK
jgi:flagellar basal-body rod protein FlgB